MNVEKLVVFVKLLQQKSKEGKVPWEDVGIKHAFDVHFADNTVRIFQQDEQWDESGINYQLIFLDSKGNVQDEISTARMGEFTGIFTFQDLEEIYLNARRKARSLDKSIDQMLSDLEKN
jgi:hypothetical protein